MRIIPLEDIKQRAREDHAKRFKKVPEPRVLNARQLLQLDAPRSLVWGGVGYWAPPLSYEDGHRLFAVSSYLHDAIRQDKPDAARKTVQTAVVMLRRLLTRRRPPLRRLREWLRDEAAAGHAFERDTPEEVLLLLRWLLFVEDDSPVIPSDQRVTVDLIDNRYSFEDRFKRPPRSWRDYVYGMHYIARQSCREDLRGAVATRIGVNADAKNWRDYERELRSHAGWANG